MADWTKQPPPGISVPLAISLTGSAILFRTFRPCSRAQGASYSPGILPSLAAGSSRGEWIPGPRLNWPRNISLASSTAKPNPKHNPEAISPMTSDPWREATRGLPIFEMNAPVPHISMNKPTKILLLCIRSFAFRCHFLTRPVICQASLCQNWDTKGVVSKFERCLAKGERWE
jgi:hypothetical protein